MTPLPPYDATSVEVPGGRVVIVVDPIDGAVVASGFADLDTVFGFLTEPEQTRGRRDADLGLRHAAAALGLPTAPRALAERARAWSPWRSYAAQHLWTRPEEKP